MGHGFDHEIVQDFLTESGELIDQLEGDLVILESSPRDLELLNKVFRALHTIKGSASFLQLTNLVKIAHAAESALNAARNNVVTVDSAAMNLLLETVDIIKTQMQQLGSGQDLAEPRAELVAMLAAIGEGKQLASAAPGAASSTATHATNNSADAPASPKPSQAAPPSGPTVRKLVLGPGKADLLEYLVADLDETMGKVQKSLNDLAGSPDAKGSASQLADTCEQLSRCVEFFEFAQMGELAGAMASAAAKLSEDEGLVSGVLPQLKSLCALVTTQAEGVKAGEMRELPADDVLGNLGSALAGLAASATSTPTTNGPTTAKPTTPEPADAPPAPTSQKAHAASNTDKASDKPGEKPGEKATDKHGATAGENTIRVEVGRLEALMNLVGELVLQKNRITSLTRKAASAKEIEAELSEAMSLAAGSLDRVTSDIQTAVMRTRMQPLDKLFGRYPRLIRDLATKTGKQIQLVIEGGDTEVDKSVIEELGDPLVHLIRNSADHGLEGPDERIKAGKNPLGTITLRASHEGSHVRVLVIDDGRGLARERIGGKAVERGLATSEQVAAMSDREVFNFIFEAGFSTAEKVSDLSGRGVGMDVVRTNIQKLKGSIELSSEHGKGTTIAITIPLTVAILQAMMVGVGPEIYAVPLTSILEIVRPQADQVSSIGGHQVMRLRDSVLPLVSAADLFEQPTDRRAEQPFAVVIQSGQKQVGLMVSRLIGQQEVVIKPLDEGDRTTRAVSGATVRDDGGVSLIVDVEQLVRMAQGSSGK